MKQLSRYHIHHHADVYRMYNNSFTFVYQDKRKVLLMRMEDMGDSMEECTHECFPIFLFPVITR